MVPKVNEIPCDQNTNVFTMKNIKECLAMNLKIPLCN